ncbi:MAG: permease prefix domain 1-containing protein [Eubacteriales bacterium]|nr:permease prefix domain 1-containing protein [Eubacteriales bacterium]
METIKSYLDNMFLSLPRTSEVIAAKQELMQMMEDKYMELKEEGKTENEAVGIVISEFGNLEEVAESLGISAVVRKEDAIKTEDGVMEVEECVTKRVLLIEDAKKYLELNNKRSNLIASGVFLCITSVCGAALSEAFASFPGVNETAADAIGATMLFVFVAIAVGLFVYAGMLMKDFSWMKYNGLITDFETKGYVEEQEKEYRYKHMLYMVIGIIFCVLCVVPAIIMDAMKLPEWCEGLSGALLFVLVAVGVYLIVKTNIKESGYEFIINDGNTAKNQAANSEKKYNNPVIQGIMDLYYPTITCIYLCWSFLTFDWHITWVIWPIAAVVRGLLKIMFRGVEE